MKYIKCLLLLTLMAVFGFLGINHSVKEVSAATVSQIDVYYYRYDNKYTGWYAWFWTETSAGLKATVSSDSTGYGYKATYKNLSKLEGQKLGLIMAYNDWAEQTGDMYFYTTDLKEVSATGVANVYYVQGEDAPCFTKEDAKKAQQQKFMHLYFTTGTTIGFETTGAQVSNLKVTCNGEEIQATVNQSGVNGTITIGSTVDLSKTYVVSCNIGSDATTKTATFDGIYDSQLFIDAFGYEGTDLGATYGAGGTTFKLWAPISKSITLNLYMYGHPTKYGTKDYPGDDTPTATYKMEKGEKGVWSYTVPGNIDGMYYTYTVENGSATNEVVDPYAKSTGVNGLRGMVVNFSSNNDKLNPAKWAADTRPFVGNNVDAVIYETQIRDMTADKSWGGDPKLSGTYVGLAQRGTTYTNGTVTVSTGLDHLIELGVTHLHILPVMDSEYADETRLNDEEYKSLLEDGIYNWGYMTKYFFSIDGCFSTDPYNGYARLYEYKEMIQTLHENGISLVMDVVFNHSSTASSSNFEMILPYYYHRSSNGKLTNGSGCGNEMASERYMMRKLIVDSLTYFASEFHVDGFRFDLMALEDTTTMNAVYDAVSKVNPNCIIYGEPWTGGTSTNTYTPSDRYNIGSIPNVGAFNDGAREAIRGKNDPGHGFITGNTSNYDRLVSAVMGGSGYYSGDTNGYTFASPNQNVNYASCHDNYSLYDQIKIPTTWSINSQNNLIMNALTQATDIVLTSQGVPFIEGGSEIGKNKRYKDESGKTQTSHNSYNMGDEVNSIDWSFKVTNQKYFNAIKDMISIRRAHQGFRQTSYAGLDSKVIVDRSVDTNMLVYQIKDSNDSWSQMLIIHANSASTSGMSYTLPQATNASGWEVVYSNSGVNKVGNMVESNNSITVGMNETVILVGNTYNKSAEQTSRYDANKYLSKAYTNPVAYADKGGSSVVVPTVEPTPTPTPVIPEAPTVDPTADVKTSYEAYYGATQQVLTNTKNYASKAKAEIMTAAQAFIVHDYKTTEEVISAYEVFVATVQAVSTKQAAADAFAKSHAFFPSYVLAEMYYNQNY